MKDIITELNSIVKEFKAKFESLSEQELCEKPLPNKWSKKEVIGHLIDSGQNNLRRFIVAQYEHQPKIVYDQNFWVGSINYQSMNSRDIIELWSLVNAQISNALNIMNKESYQKMCDTSKENEQLRSIEWLASDYVKHLKHHLNQVISESFDIVYL